MYNWVCHFYVQPTALLGMLAEPLHGSTARLPLRCSELTDVIVRDRECRACTDEELATHLVDLRNERLRIRAEQLRDRSVMHDIVFSGR